MNGYRVHPLTPQHADVTPMPIEEMDQPMNADVLVQFIMYLVPMLLSLTVHEYSHARAAFWLGDDTASMQGRLTLNPLPHIDPFGTLLIPAIGIMSGFPFFGWAKPVPTNPVRYVRIFFGERVGMNAGMALVAFAGPLSNILFAFFVAGLLGAMVHFVPPSKAIEPVYMLLLPLLKVNVGLAIFNLLPLPPLDGSRIVYWLLPTRHQPLMDALTRYTPFMFVGLLLLMNTRIFYIVFAAPFRLILGLLSSIFGLEGIV